MNILNILRELIVSDAQLKEIIGSRVYYYEVPETSDTSKPFVVLTPINDDPSSFVSDKYLSESYFVQVDVETYKHQTTIDVTKRIRYLLFQMNMYQTSSQLDDYFKETKRYVMSRRYRGIPKINFIKVSASFRCAFYIKIRRNLHYGFICSRF